MEFDDLGPNPPDAFVSFVSDWGRTASGFRFGKWRRHGDRHFALRWLIRNVLLRGDVAALVAPKGGFDALALVAKRLAESVTSGKPIFRDRTILTGTVLVVEPPGLRQCLSARLVNAASADGRNECFGLIGAGHGFEAMAKGVRAFVKFCDEGQSRLRLVLVDYRTAGLGGKSNNGRDAGTMARIATLAAELGVAIVVTGLGIDGTRTTDCAGTVLRLRHDGDPGRYRLELASRHSAERVLGSFMTGV